MTSQAAKGADFSDCILFSSPVCPYCLKVMRFMDANGIELEIRDVFDPGASEELQHIGGKNQVPCLVIDGKAMYESDDIIDYLGTRL